MMNYLIRCAYLQHAVQAEGAPLKGDAVSCFASCPRYLFCPLRRRRGFFDILSVVPNDAAGGLFIEKGGNTWKYVSGKTAQNCDIQATHAGFAQEKKIEAEQPKKKAEHVPPAPKPVPKTEAKPVFSLRGNEPVTPVAEEQKPEPKPVAAFPQREPQASAFPIRDSKPSSIPTREEPRPFPVRGESSSAFPVRGESAPATETKNEDAKPTFLTRGSGGLRDQLSAFRHPAGAKDSVLRDVTAEDFESMSIGGILYTDDFQLQRSKHGMPLAKALDEIRGHWQLGLVFEDNHTLAKRFIWLLLKLRLLPNKEKEERISSLLSATIYEGIEADKSAKLFYLIQNILPKARIHGFFYPTEDKFSFARLLPWFTDVNDYVLKFFASDQSGILFRKMCQKHLPEVMYYLGFSHAWPTRETRDAFNRELAEKQAALFDDFVIRHYESTNRLVYIRQQGDAYSVEDLGPYDAFLQNMQFPQTLETSRKMYAFLKRFRFTPMGTLLPRDPAHPLAESEKPDFEDSRVYAFLGLIDATYYLEEYNLFATLLGEYLETFDPDNVSVNGIVHFSKFNFIAEVRSILLDACQAAFSIEMPGREAYIGKALLTYSLIQRGVLARYVSVNESKKQFGLYLELFAKLANNELTVEDYSSVFGKDALYYLDGESLTPREYMLRCAKTKSLEEFRRLIKENDIIASYYKQDAAIEKSIDKRVAAYAKAFAKFE